MNGRPGFGVEQETQLCQSLSIVRTVAAHITNPGWEIRNGDQVIAQPGHQRGIPHLFDAALAV